MRREKGYCAYSTRKKKSTVTPRQKKREKKQAQVFHSFFKQGRDTIKEVLESLVSDTLVDVDSLGASRGYWSLPSQAYIRLKTRNEQLDQQCEQSKQKQEEITQQIEQAKIGRELTPDRSEKDKLLFNLKQDYDQQIKGLNILRRFDPERIQQLLGELQKHKYSANQWTDNIIQLSYYLRNQANMTPAQFEELGIPLEIDNI